MDKHDFEKEYFTIKEFANLVGVPETTLRHYDNIGIFPAAKRGSGTKSNYRYYHPTQITTFKMIRVLSALGVSLNDIKEITHNRTPQNILKLLSRQKTNITYTLHQKQEEFSVVNTFLDLLVQGLSATETEITVYEMPEMRIILGKRNDFTGSEGFYSEYIRFCKAPHTPKLNLSFPIGGYFDSMDDFLRTPSQPLRFFSLDPKGHDYKNAGLYVVGYTRGYYGETNDLPERMKAYADENGLEFSGPVYHIYLFDEISVSDPDNYLLQVAASVTDTRETHSHRSHNYRF